MDIDDFNSIFIGQDGTIIPDIILKKFSLKPGIDFKYRNKEIGKEIFDTVGLFIENGNLLIIFPKHYFSQDFLLSNYQGNLHINDIEILFDVISIYIFDKQLSSDKFFGQLNNFDSDYPFSEFFFIYRHFKKYGLYKEEEVIIANTGRKVNWKKTLTLSNKIFSKGNLLFHPLLFNKSTSINNFISNCMAFVINYTLRKFNFLIKYPILDYNFNFDFYNNREYTLNELREYQRKNKKDIYNLLIINLILFFEKLDKSDSGDLNVKIKFFNLIWENMVHNYINRNVKQITDKGIEIVENINKYNFTRQTFKIDASKNKYKISPDYYLIDAENQYILDAKYYSSINSLNYKQYTYHSSLKNQNTIKKTYSLLIAPTNESNNIETHFILDKNFIGDNDQNIQIIIQYLNIKDVMKNYIK